MSDHGCRRLLQSTDGDYSQVVPVGYSDPAPKCLSPTERGAHGCALGPADVTEPPPVATSVRDGNGESWRRSGQPSIPTL
jgi:hypothetical protein